MAEFWKSLPSWVRNIVVPIVVLIVAWNVLWAVLGLVGAIVAFAFKTLIVVGIAAAVVILVRRAVRS
jgi:hypothetical protein